MSDEQLDSSRMNLRMHNLEGPWYQPELVGLHRFYGQTFLGNRPELLLDEAARAVKSFGVQYNRSLSYWITHGQSPQDVRIWYYIEFKVGIRDLVAFAFPQKRDSMWSDGTDTLQHVAIMRRGPVSTTKMGEIALDFQKSLEKVYANRRGLHLV